MNKRFIVCLFLLAMGGALYACVFVRTDKGCKAELLELIPETILFAENSFVSTPDTGVSVESLANPLDVCHVNFEIPGGNGAIFNLYMFEGTEKASVGFQKLRQQSTKINPEFDKHVDSPILSTNMIQADEMSISCSMREERKICTAVAHYGNYVYWLDLIQGHDSVFISNNLERILIVLDADFSDDTK